MPDVVTGTALEHASTVAKTAADSGVADQYSIMQAVYVSIMAFSIVFAVLIVVAALMVLLGKIVDGASKKVAATVAKPISSSSASSGDSNEIDDETVAAITAAISMCMQGRRYRVANLAGYDVQTARWAMAGRQRLQGKKG
jgi:sodium pump decarboxylase gamma subunit